jgi:threonine synthase
MAELKKAGMYKLSVQEKSVLDKEFYANYADENDCRQTIYDVFEEYGYVLDTHTAVAYNVADDFVKNTGNNNAVVVLSTASPYKFAHDVLDAIAGNAPTDAFKSANQLYEITAAPIPEQIISLKSKEKRFTEVIDRNDTVDAVMNFIGK